MHIPVNADLSRSSRVLRGAGTQPPARPEGARLLSQKGWGRPSGPWGECSPSRPSSREVPGCYSHSSLPRSCVSARLWDAGGCNGYRALAWGQEWRWKVCFRGGFAALPCSFWGGKKIIKEVIILLLHSPVCPSSCCPPRTTNGGLSL